MAPGAVLTSIGWGYIQPVGPAGQVVGSAAATAAASAAPPTSSTAASPSTQPGVPAGGTPGVGKSHITGTIILWKETQPDITTGFVMIGHEDVFSMCAIPSREAIWV